MADRAPLLVVAGESSGDDMAARVLEHLRVSASGVGGPALARRGVRLLAELPELATMGLTDVLLRLPRLSRLAQHLLRLASTERPRAALLVGYSELNGWLGPRLRALGVKVLWYGAPQVWAWRPGRRRRLREACDRMVVLLPFEQALWREAGVRADYFGHPALERSGVCRSDARQRLGIAPEARAALLLPGSRPREVDRLSPVLLAAACRLERAGVRAWLACAPGLGPRREHALARAAREAGVIPERISAELFSAFDVALACSGTATLECALAGVPPAIAYRTDPLTAAVAQRLLRVREIGLPNLVLGGRVFPELIQRALTPESAAAAALQILEQDAGLHAACRRVRDALAPGADPAPSRRVAEILQELLR